MKIGLNATCFNDRPSGANQRFAGLYGALIRQCPEFHFVIFEPADCRVSEWFGSAPNVSARRTPIPSEGRLRRMSSGFFYWRSALKRESLDIFESFHLPAVWAPDCVNILTLHDLRYLRDGEPWLSRFIYTRILRAALQRVDCTLAVSNTVRGEIRAFDDRAVVETIYNGIFAQQIAEVVASAKTDQQVHDRFILAVGHLEKRKNYVNLIEAFSILAQLPVNLVIVGNEGGERSNLDSKISDLDLGKRVQILQNVSDAELRRLYAMAELVVFPSIYEGFGIPVLEAMAARKPLVLSGIPIFKELTEGQGVYFDPLDTSAIAATIERTLNSPAECQRLRLYGDNRLKDFDFARLAEQLEAIYRSAASVEHGRKPQRPRQHGLL